MRLLPLILLLLISANAQQPAAHWSFDGATVADRLKESYGRGALGLTEAGGSSSWTTRNGFGEVLANGTNLPYLTVPVSPDLDPGTGDFSLSVWSYRTSSDAAAAGLVDALSATATSGFQWFYQANETLRFRIDDNQGNTVTADTAAPQLALNNWQHLVVTVDRANKKIRFFTNGAQVAPLDGIDISTITGAVTPDQNLWLGTLNGTSAAKGRLDDPAMFKRVLSVAEISALNAGGGTPVLTVWPPTPAPPAVTITPPSGVFRDRTTITLEAAGGEIRYTLDGSDPTASSTLYAAPFELTASATVRARSFFGTTGGPISSAAYARVPSAPPNILVIVGDDLGFNDLGCYGAVTVATPRLDGLARRGQRFTQFTTAGPGNLASQYALLTARLARRPGLPETLADGMPGMDPREWTLAESLRKAGYQTGFVGAWHLGDVGGSRPVDQGFGTVSQSPATLAQLTGDAAAFIAAHAAGPFFLMFQPPAQAAAGASLLGSYGNQIEALDAAVGTLLDQLAALALTDRTLVLFLSDGGADRAVAAYPTGSNGQLRDGRGTTWEGGVRVPCIASWPTVIPAVDNFAVLWLPDLFPSLAAICGTWTATDRPLDGTARTDVLLGSRSRPDDGTTLYLHRHNGSAWQLRALRSGRWKLHQAYNNSDPGNTNPGTNTAFNVPAPLLFDLEADPIEHVTRASTQTAITAALQALAGAHEASFATPVPQLPAAKPPWFGSVVTAVAGDSRPPSATFSFTRPADSLDDHYVIEHTADLTSWQALASAPFVTAAVVHADGTESVTLTVPLDLPEFTPPRHFIRLKANRP